MGGGGMHDLRTGRKLGGGDLQLLMLLLLSQQPRHGYELIKAIEAQSNGFYVPSSGVIYPSLNLLEEMDYAVAEQQGTRRRYAITGPGQAYLDQHRAEAEALMSQLASIGERMQSARRAFAGLDDAQATDLADAVPGLVPDLERARRDLKHLLGELRESDGDIQARATVVLQRALEELRALLA
jgi:DNA-binding PadR family transcriptional regulator